MTVHLDRIVIARDCDGDELSTPHRNGAVAAKSKAPKKMPDADAC
jgi:hypothetical protein